MTSSFSSGVGSGALISFLTGVLPVAGVKGGWERHQYQALATGALTGAGGMQAGRTYSARLDATEKGSHSWAGLQWGRKGAGGFSTRRARRLLRAAGLRARRRRRRAASGGCMGPGCANRRRATWRRSGARSRRGVKDAVHSAAWKGWQGRAGQGRATGQAEPEPRARARLEEWQATRSAPCSRESPAVPHDRALDHSTPPQGHGTGLTLLPPVLSSIPPPSPVASSHPATCPSSTAGPGYMYTVMQYMEHVCTYM